MRQGQLKKKDMESLHYTSEKKERRKMMPSSLNKCQSTAESLLTTKIKVKMQRVIANFNCRQYIE